MDQDNQKGHNQIWVDIITQRAVGDALLVRLSSEGPQLAELRFLRLDPFPELPQSFCLSASDDLVILHSFLHLRHSKKKKSEFYNVHDTFFRLKAWRTKIPSNKVSLFIN